MTGGNTSLPFLDVKNADVCEIVPDDLVSRFGDPSHAVAVILIKIRLLLDLRAMRNCRILRSKAPPEILDTIRSTDCGQLCNSPRKRKLG